MAFAAVVSFVATTKRTTVNAYGDGDEEDARVGAARARRGRRGAGRAAGDERAAPGDLPAVEAAAT